MATMEPGRDHGPMKKLPIARWRKVVACVAVFIAIATVGLVFAYAELNCSFGPGDNEYWACRQGSTYWPDALRAAGIVVLIGIALLAQLLERPLDRRPDQR